MNWLRLAPSAPVIDRWIDDATGCRFYAIPDGKGGTIGVPGVTSVLGFTDSDQDRSRLEAWRQREIAAGRDPEAAAKRGTAVHACLEQYIRGFEPKFPTNEIRQFYDGMSQYLNDFTEYVWSEKPLRFEHNHCWNTQDRSDPNRLARVWSAEYGFSGTPDLIAVRNGKYVLVDFKTSNRPYYKPDDPSETITYANRIGYKKYLKTVKQLALYSIAIKETLDLEISQFEIIIGLAGSTPAQHFAISDDEIANARRIALHGCQTFWTKYQQAIADARQAGLPTVESRPEPGLALAAA